MTQQLVNELPTSNIEVFKDQLNNPNREFKNVIQKNLSYIIVGLIEFTSGGLRPDNRAGPGRR